MLIFAAALVTALVVAGCGRDDFKNDPRPPIPAEVSVKIAKDGVAVSPNEFGAGIVNFTIANLTTEPGTLAIHGPVDADSSEIPPNRPTVGSRIWSDRRPASTCARCAASRATR